MTTLREAAQQALEAMDKATRFMSDSDYRNLNKSIEDLKTALEESVQDPVAWLRLRDGKLAVADGGNFGDDWMPLYTDRRKG